MPCCSQSKAGAEPPRRKPQPAVVPSHPPRGSVSSFALCCADRHPSHLMCLCCSYLAKFLCSEFVSSPPGFCRHGVLSCSLTRSSRISTLHYRCSPSCSVFPNSDCFWHHLIFFCLLSPSIPFLFHLFAWSIFLI